MESESPRTRLTLVLAADSGTVRGSLGAADEAEREFSGYVELMSLIEEIRRTHPTVPADTAEQLRRT